MIRPETGIRVTPDDITSVCSGRGFGPLTPDLLAHAW